MEPLPPLSSHLRVPLRFAACCHAGHCRGHVHGRGWSDRTSGCSWVLLGVGVPAGLSVGRSLGWPQLPSPAWCCSFKAGLGSLAGPWPPQAKLPSVATGLATLLSMPPGISPASSLGPRSVWGGDRTSLAVSGRNGSDRGCGRVKLTWHMRLELSPKPPGTKPPPGWGPSNMEAGLPRWKAASHPPSPRGPGPSCFIHCPAWHRHQGQQEAALRIAISHVGPHFPGPTLAGPSPGPMPGPLEGGPGRRGLALAILQHHQVWPTPGAPGLPLGGGPSGRSMLRTFC